MATCNLFQSILFVALASSTLVAAFIVPANAPNRLRQWRFLRPDLVDFNLQLASTDPRSKREMDHEALAVDNLDELNKRTSLKRLVYLSARGFGRR
ncbi:unnamed protein product [Caenorhabditis auriculariae]|uniref:Uncharacterized protein n=1 Tax=Caenorhabditis auriculariae TaxID=2777116 RepID=A0A8S1H246_9PELO|nr:unnamed protein product [Caenorhabditis auriculariae]